MSDKHCAKKARHSDDDVSLTRKSCFAEIAVRHICEHGLSEKLLGHLYQTRVGKEAIQQTIEAHTLKADRMQPAKLSACIRNLSSFPRLRSLTIERRPNVYPNLRFNGLRNLVRLKRLKLVRCPNNDASLMQEIRHLTGLEEVIIDDPYGFSIYELGAIQWLPQLRSFSLISKSDVAVNCTFDQLHSCRQLQNLTLKLGRGCPTPNFNAIAGLPQLQTLVLSFAVQSVQLAALSTMASLQALTLECALPRSDEHKLSQLTRLTSLEFQTIVAGMPQWLRNLESLRCLSIFWQFSSNPGKLNDFLPYELESLTLRGITTPIERYILSHFQRLRKLRLYYTVSKGESVKKDALQDLHKVKDLLLKCICFNSSPCALPSFDHMTGLTKLDVETAAELDLAPIKKNLRQLRHLAIGKNFLDDDIKILASMSTLETLILKNAHPKTEEGLLPLSRLPKLQDLCLYYCTEYPMRLPEIEYLVRMFETLKHLGICPLSDYNAELIPSPLLQETTLFDEMNVAAHPEIRGDPLYSILNPSVEDDSLVIDTGYRVLKIDTDCRLE